MLNAGVPDSDHCILFAHVPVNVFFSVVVVVVVYSTNLCSFKIGEKEAAVSY